MICCEALTKRFGHFTAVDHVSFSVAKGSIFGFLGPEGSGKSTVIRRFCGFNRATLGLPVGLIPSKLFALGFKQKIA